ncbi:hypothetical protein [Weissella fangxianensis]|uniref:hypothetical protein n=1 Tax=Weissella fangxianensis TaxID=2953879 RepID=UPI002157727C|nr:hypothetical protein [Weissella fangxianensis]
MEKNKDTKDERHYKIFNGILGLVVGLWLAIPSLFSFFDHSTGSVVFWIDFIAIIVGVISVISGINELRHIKK